MGAGVRGLYGRAEMGGKTWGHLKWVDLGVVGGTMLGLVWTS